MIPTLDQRYDEATAELTARYGWGEQDRAALSRQAAAAVHKGIASDPRRAALFVFSQALHQACMDDASPAREAAYGALFRFLYEVARARYTDVAEEASQAALVRVFFTIRRCREPGAFLAFSLHALLDAARAARKERGADPPPSDEIAALGEDLAAAMVDAEHRTRIAALVAEFARRYPRARRQLAALRMKYLDGMDEAAIAAALGVSVKVVYTLRARAAARLRADPAWRALAADVGLIIGDV
jgi:DNA-directed RNA polymerase specialized sigma24 family protein